MLIVSLFLPQSNVSGRVVLSCEDILVANTGEETFHIPEVRGVEDL